MSRHAIPITYTRTPAPNRTPCYPIRQVQDTTRDTKDQPPELEERDSPVPELVVLLRVCALAVTPFARFHRVAKTVVLP